MPEYKTFDHITSRAHFLEASNKSSTTTTPQEVTAIQSQTLEICDDNIQMLPSFEQTPGTKIKKNYSKKIGISPEYERILKLMKDHPHSETIAQGYLDIIQDIKNEKLNIKMFPSKSKVFEDIYKKVNVSIIFLNSKVKGMGRKKVGDL